MPYVTGPDILQHVAGSGAPSSETPDEDWADICAAAIEGAIAQRLSGETPTADQNAQLAATALQDGAALYIARKAPHGVVSFGPDGDVVRQGSELLRASEAVLFRISPGIG